MSRSTQLMCVVQQRCLGRLLLACVVGFASIYTSLGLAAGFTTNFVPNGSGYSINVTGYCGYGGCQSDIGNGDPTPFGIRVENIDGVNYFHTLVGDPATGFAVESYTRVNGLNASNSIDSNGTAFSPDGGGNERSVIGTGAAATPSFLQNSMNMSNSLGNPLVSGTGSVDPNYTVFRMVLNDPDAGMSMDVSKPFLDKKPLISQTVQDGTMKSVFVADERALSYSDSSTPAPVSNTLVINDPLLPTAGAADFEMALAQIPDVTAGRYTFTRGTGWNDPTLGWNTPGSTFGEGTYTYVGAQGFDPLSFNWASVFNYDDNSVACTRSGSGANSVIRENVGIYGGSCFNKP